MLDQNDIKQIDAVVTKRLDERFATSDKKLDERFAVNNKIIVQEVVLQVGEFLEQNVLPLINDLPSKDFVSRQTAEVKGTVTARLHTQNTKVLSDEQLRKLQELEVFPSLDNVPV